MKRTSCLMLVGLVMLLLPLQVAHARTDITVNRFQSPNQSKSLPVLEGLRARSTLGHPAIPESEPEAECTQSTRPPIAGVHDCLFHIDTFTETVRRFHREEVIERRWWRLHRQRERRRIAAERRARREARLRAAAERRPTYVSETAVRPPKAAPPAVKDAIRAADEIATTPYIWGGGHGSWRDAGYDCSGAVSYALHGAGLLNEPLPSGSLESYGEPGPGRWITIYANAGHAYAVIAGLRWDTVGDEEGTGPRWHKEPPYPSGFVVRHPPGY